MKRIYTILIAAVALLLAFMAAAAADTVIKKVDITVTAPAVGAKANFTAQVNAVGCTFRKMEWYDVTDEEFLKDGDTFQADHAYRTSVFLKAEHGYEFDWAGGTIATINGKEPLVSRFFDNEVRHVFTNLIGEKKLINKVDITVTAPAVGAKASFTAQVNAVGCTFSKMEWYDEADKKFLKDGDIFKADHAYSTTVYLKADQGYEFDWWGETVATINGKEPIVRGLFDDGVELVFTNLMSERKLIDRVDIILTEPAVGVHAIHAATVKNAHCSFSGQFYDLTWLDVTDKEDLDLLGDLDTFIAGHVYKVDLDVHADDGYVFKTGETVFTINGRTAKGIIMRSDYAQVYFTFNALAANDSFTGFKQQNGGLYYFKDGKVDTTADGLVLEGMNNVFYFCAAGRVQTQHTGIAMYGGQFFYVVGGALDVNKAGLITYDGERFIIAAGRILIEYNGLIQDPNSGKWYYVAAGQVVNYTGLALYDGAWFYVINGELGVNFTGEVEYDGAKFNVVNGMLVA